jgi:hypothetical protein
MHTPDAPDALFAQWYQCHIDADDPDDFTGIPALFRSWRRWCAANETPSGPRNAFIRRLETYGHKCCNRHGLVGCALFLLAIPRRWNA